MGSEFSVSDLDPFNETFKGFTAPVENIGDFFKGIKNEAQQARSEISREFKDFSWSEEFLRNNAAAIRQQIPQLKDHLSLIQLVQDIDPLSLKLENYYGHADPMLAPDYIKVFANESSNGSTDLAITNYFPLSINVIGSSVNAAAMENQIRPSAMFAFSVSNLCRFAYDFHSLKTSSICQRSR